MVTLVEYHERNLYFRVISSLSLSVWYELLGHSSEQRFAEQYSELCQCFRPKGAKAKNASRLRMAGKNVQHCRLVIEPDITASTLAAPAQNICKEIRDATAKLQAT